MITCSRSVFVGAIGIVLSGLLSVPAAATTPGVVITQIKGGAAAAALAPFPDGSVAVAATGNDSKIRVLKYTPSGKLNAYFGQDGVATLDIPGKASAAAVAVTSGGKVVVAGTVDNQVLAARLTARGVLDTAFNGVGYRKTSLGGAGDQAVGVALGSAGEVYLLATAKGKMAVVKYKTNGAIDTSYGGSGVARADGGGTASAAALDVRRDGRIVAVGTVRTDAATSDSLLLARFTTSGRLDDTFGATGSGTVVISDNKTIRTGPVMVVDGTDRILVAGTLAGQFAVTRYTAQGKPDNTFGTNGTGRSGVIGIATTVVVFGADITVAGTTNGKAGVARFKTNGMRLNDTYGNNGVATADLGGAGATVVGVVVDTTGRTIIVGTSDGRIAVARFTTTGKLDDNFHS